MSARVEPWQSDEILGLPEGSTELLEERPIDVIGLRLLIRFAELYKIDHLELTLALLPKKERCDK